VIDKFLELGQDSVFVKDLQTMFKGTETIVRDLGSAMVDVFAGLTAFFSALMPNVTEFTGGIRDAAAGFRDWAQSEGTRKKIADWFTMARDIGGQVWAIVKEIALAFHDLFTAAGESEETVGFLDTILEKVELFREKIRLAKEDGSLDQWFADAKETASSLWQAIKDIGTALKELNTEENRAWLNKMIEAVGTLSAAFITMTKIGEVAFQIMFAPAINLYNRIKMTVDIVKGLVERFTEAKSEGKSTFDSIKAAVQPFTDALKNAWDWIGRIISRLSQVKFPSIPSAFTSLAGKLFAAGGITRGPSIAGEAGPEMIIPLTRPLNQVDPSVRAIAAMLRGQGGDQIVTGGGATGPTKIVNNDIKVYAPSSDPEAVAVQVVNRSVAMAM
jgi:hypothetical protein